MWIDPKEYNYRAASDVTLIMMAEKGSTEAVTELERRKAAR